MKPLQNVTPTAEQLKLITLPRPGKRIIRGAAGSGKTTTSLLMLRTSLSYLLDYYRESDESPIIKVNVFTFNKTLAAYVREVLNEMSQTMLFSSKEVNITIGTLGSYLKNSIGCNQDIITISEQYQALMRFCNQVPLENNFLIDEVEYLLGRLSMESLESYIDLERTGRGTKPRVEKVLRRQILDKIVYPYLDYKKNGKIYDWNDLALVASEKKFDNINIAIIDEAQDFSANQLKAIMTQLAPESFTTIVLDSAQRIYKRGFTWKEVGISDATYARLEFNYRNTKQIAAFAQGLLENSKVSLDEDSTAVNINQIKKTGPTPEIVQGSFSKQIDHIFNYIEDNIDLEEDTVGFLHPKGGGWFRYIIERLNGEKLSFIEIAKKKLSGQKVQLI